MSGSFATDGLNDLSDRLHRYVRDAVLPSAVAARPRPVTFNTWEAVYFDHDMGRLEALAVAAAALGVERFVLDDGWFRGRDDDTSSLGDWTPDPRKYPGGLRPLAEHVRALGMSFGLWVEPEMANAESGLLRAHPDWILGEVDRPQHKRFRSLLHRGGRLRRLSHPEPGLTPRWPLPASLRLTGLEPDRTYAVELLNPPRHPERRMKQVLPLHRGERSWVQALL